MVEDFPDRGDPGLLVAGPVGRVMSLRKYMVLDTRSRSLVLDEQGDPLRFVALDEALDRAIAMPGRQSPESFAVLDDLGNKWLWSKKGVLRIALSMFTQDHVNEEVRKPRDRQNTSMVMQTRCTPSGIVETSHYVRLPDGPPVEVLHFGRPTGSTTTERWSQRAEWFTRGPLSDFVDRVPTRIHKLEQKALNDKKRARQAHEKRRNEEIAYEAGKKMTCQICGRSIRSKIGIIAHHGYRRPWDGYQSASCRGAQHWPLEVSNGILLEEIRDHEQQIARTVSHLDRVYSGDLPVVVTVKPHRNENRTSPHVYTTTPETYDAVRSESGGRPLMEHTFADQKRWYIEEIRARLRNWKASLIELRKRNEGWKQTRVFLNGKFEPIWIEPSKAKTEKRSSSATERPWASRRQSRLLASECRPKW
jgi:hypothetical protein